MAEQHPALVKKYYGKLADTSKDGVTAFNTTFAQDGLLLYVPKKRGGGQTYSAGEHIAC